MKQLVAWYSVTTLETRSSHSRIICISFENEYGVCRKWLRFLIFESRRNVYFRKEIRSSLISALNFIKILITYFTCIESNRISFFFKSFQILSNPWWYFDNRFWNVDPSQLVTHREFERRTLLIGWNFVPRFKNSRRHCVSTTSWLLFIYFSSQRYRSHDCFANGIWGNENC